MTTPDLAPPNDEGAPAPVAFGPEQVLESLLFVAAEPLSITDLARAAALPADTVESTLERLAQAYQARGIRLQRHAGRVQLVSAPEAAGAIGRLLGVPTSQRLTTAALEVLAIIAYRQPITRSQIEAVRGVDCSAVVRALLARELIAEQGRLETVGRPILYGTTPEFLRQFGLDGLCDLPALDLPG